MKKRKLKIQIVINHEIDATNRMFDPLVAGIENQALESVHRLVVGSLRKPEHSPLWRGANTRVVINPEYWDDSVGQCCATCKHASQEGAPICRYNISDDYSKCCDLHEWSSKLIKDTNEERESD